MLVIIFFCEYLSITIRLKSFLSSQEPVAFGVPQGSPLSIILFQTYIYDIPIYKEDLLHHLLQPHSCITYATVFSISVTLQATLALGGLPLPKSNHFLSTVLQMVLRRPRLQCQLSSFTLQPHALPVTCSRRFSSDFCQFFQQKAQQLKANLFFEPLKSFANFRASASGGKESSTTMKNWDLSSCPVLHAQNVPFCASRISSPETESPWNIFFP